MNIKISAMSLKVPLTEPSHPMLSGRPPANGTRVYTHRPWKEGIGHEIEAGANPG
jgi:hypothetical protein